MKVIKKSSAGAKTKRFKCNDCRATLEVEGKDLTFRSDDRDGAAYTFVCPECKKENWIAANLITPAMKAASKG